MSELLIVGGGFAGTKAMRRLKTQSRKGRISVTLVDPKPGFDFLPALPDVLSGGFGREHLRVPYQDLAEAAGATFFQDRVTEVDLQDKIAHGEERNYPFDYVIVATGARTNFYGNITAAEQALRLRSLDQADEIVAALAAPAIDRVFVVGGGYTGVETATHIKRRSQRNSHPLTVEILELTDSLLPGQEPWIQRYARRQVDKLGIRVRLETTVEKLDGEVLLTDKSSYKNSIVVWNAGVEVVVPIPEGMGERSKGGRLAVDEYLRAAPECYVVGDAAAVVDNEKTLPMASYFSDQQGALAARNILRGMRGKSPKAYRPRNYGLVIPFATGKGCGRLLGIPLKGRPALLVHHLTAWMRARSAKNRWGRLWDAIR